MQYCGVLPFTSVKDLNASFITDYFSVLDYGIASTNKTKQMTVCTVCLLYNVQSEKKEISHHRPSHDKNQTAPNCMCIKK